MRRPPPLPNLPRYPVVGGIALLAIGVTVAWHGGKVDISPILAGPEMVEKWQLWRLVTPVLPHGGVLHLVFNLYWMWVFGTLVEETFGHARTFAIILLLAVGSCGAEYALFHGGVGLSGVVYGLFGMLWVLSRRDARFADAVDPSTAATMVGWFFFCIVTTVTGVMPIANVAHGVGAVLGALLGLAIAAPHRAQRALGTAGIVVLVAASVAGAMFGRPWVNLTKERGEEWARIGTRDLTAGHSEDAVLHLRKAVAIDDDQAWAWFNLGIAYQNVGLREEAAGAFEHASRLEPGDRDYSGAAARARVRATRAVGEQD